MKTLIITLLILVVGIPTTAQTIEQKLEMATQIANQTLDENATLKNQVKAVQSERDALKNVIVIDSQIQTNDQIIIKMQMDLITKLQSMVGKKSGRFKLVCILCR